MLFTPDGAGFAERLAQVRDRAEREVARRRADGHTADDATTTAADESDMSATEGAR